MSANSSLKAIAALVNDSVVGLALHVSCVGNAVLCAGLSYLYMTSESFPQLLKDRRRPKICSDQRVFQHRPLVGLVRPIHLPIIQMYNC